MHALNNCVAVALAFGEREWEFLSEDTPVWLWPYTVPVGLIALCVLLVAGVRIDRIAQVNRPHTRGWPRRRSSTGKFTFVLPS